MTDDKEINPDERSEEVNIPCRKKAMRAYMRRVMDGRTGDSTRVVQQIVDYLDKRKYLQKVALFAPMHGEVDLLSLTKMRDKCWVFPKVTQDFLIFQQVRNVKQDLQPGAFGILEPVKSLPAVLIGEIDLFLCPGLAFDSHGGRIGRGKGFYDTALAETRPDAIRLGICFEYQLVDEVAMEDHDIRMHGVIAG